MPDKISFNISKINELHKYVFWGLLVINVFIMVGSVYSYSITPLIISLIAEIVLLIFVIIYYVRPTVVTADAEKLQYKHILTVTIPLKSIRNIKCEPYEHLIRYGMHQHRIRLRITTDNGNEYELNDKLDADALVNDRLYETQTDIPLMKLYEFLKEKTDYSRGIEASE